MSVVAVFLSVFSLSSLVRDRGGRKRARGVLFFVLSLVIGGMDSHGPMSIDKKRKTSFPHMRAPKKKRNSRKKRLLRLFRLLKSMS